MLGKTNDGGEERLWVENKKKMVNNKDVDQEKC
jgi:hypothetical protein